MSDPEVPMVEASSHELLEICRCIEQQMARLYRQLAQAHAGRHVEPLWLKTAREEDNHAAQFSLLLRRPDLPEVRVDPSRAQKALDVVQDTLAAWEKSPPSVAEALRAALALEHTLRQYHADVAVVLPADQARLFRAMMAADADHVGELSAALEREQG